MAWPLADVPKLLDHRQPMAREGVLGALVISAGICPPVCTHTDKYLSFVAEELSGLNPRANYIDRAKAACRRS
jgi:hypothetical protein